MQQQARTKDGRRATRVPDRWWRIAPLTLLMVGLLAACSSFDDPTGDLSAISLSSIITGDGSPLGTRTLSGTATIVADVSGSVESVAFFIDGSTEPEEVTGGHKQFEFTLDTTTLTDGEHELIIVGHHISGNEERNLTESVTFVVDNSSGGDDGSGDTDDGTGDGDDGSGDNDDGSDDGTGDGSGPADPDAEVLWRATMEGGNLAQWSADYPGTSQTCGGEYNNGGGDSWATDQTARTGSWSAKLVIENVNDSQGTRLRRGPCESNDHPEGLYYSAWFFVPQHYETTAGWWNIFQFKSKDADKNTQVMWVLDLLDQEDGTMAFRLRDKHDDSSEYFHQDEPLRFPIGEWVHVEAFYVPSSRGEGVVRVWQNGVKIFDFTGRNTVLPNGGDARWYVNNYTRGIQPDDPAVLFVDDAAISTGRLGPNY